MKILLAQRLPWFPALAGETTSNRWLLESLAERGHSCRVVALAMPGERAGAVQQLRAAMTARGTPPVHSSPTVDAYGSRGVDVRVVADGIGLCATLEDQIRQFEPGCVLISQDRTCLALATALAAVGPSRVVYMAHSPATLPFGPECFEPDEAKTDLLRRAGHIVAPSRYIADYIIRWSGLDARAFCFPPCGSGPFPNLGRPDSGFITLVNPSQIKGIGIFEGLARARPADRFAAVPTWATTTADLDRLQRLRNVRILPPVENIEDVLGQTRVLLVPSLWGEGYGLIAVEAMLRGIPVLASDIGGLPEAKMGVDYLLPVRPIERYQEEVDERGLPVPVVPPQDLAPWLEALERLADSRHYRQLSEASQAAAVRHVAGLSVTPFERFLAAAGRVDGPAASGRDRGEEEPSLTANLSRDRLELLAKLLRRGHA